MKNACTVGLFPKELEDRVVQMGNGAARGPRCAS